jgi:hypothetical protein
MVCTSNFIQVPVAWPLIIGKSAINESFNGNKSWKWMVNGQNICQWWTVVSLGTKKHERFGIHHEKKCDLLFKKSDFATYMIEPSEIRM